MVSPAVVGVEFDGTPEPSLGPCPVPLVHGLQIPKSGVGLSERLFDLDRAPCRCPGSGEGLSGRHHALRSEHQKRVSHSGPSKTIAGILRHGLLKQLLAFRDAVTAFF